MGRRLHLSSSPSNHFGLLNSVQTNFGNDYVFQISSRFDWSLMGVSLSSNMVKLYSPSTGLCCGMCRSHMNSINHISFLGPSSPHLIVYRSSDGTVRVWDTISFKEMGLTHKCLVVHLKTSSASPLEVRVTYLLSAGCKSQHEGGIEKHIRKEFELEEAMNTLTGCDDDVEANDSITKLKSRILGVRPSLSMNRRGEIGQFYPRSLNLLYSCL